MGVSNCVCLILCDLGISKRGDLGPSLAVASHDKSVIADPLVTSRIRENVALVNKSQNTLCQVI